MNKVLVVDCNDSFVYNLVQLLRENPDCSFEVVNVHRIPFERISVFSHILLSPGPGVPKDYPPLFTLLEKTLNTHCILGVCLGMQAIATYFGCRLKQLSFPKHGHESKLKIVDSTYLFKNIPSDTAIGRYHSWVVDPESLTDTMEVLALDEENHIMALKHRYYSIYGVQFHPESVITKNGVEMIRNWLG